MLFQICCLSRHYEMKALAWGEALFPLPTRQARSR